MPSVICAIAVVATVAWSRYRFYQRTGSVAPVRIVESLQSPIAVTGWASDGISLADGRKVKLRGFKSLPLSSQALGEMTKRGVEVAADGSVYGLVLVHHWCGNDPVEEHIARVELSEAMAFLGEGERENPSDRASKLRLRNREGGFSQYGWDVGEFMSFETVQSILR